jgi:hypothetical protein
LPIGFSRNARAKARAFSFLIGGRCLTHPLFACEIKLHMEQVAGAPCEILKLSGILFAFSVHLCDFPTGSCFNLPSDMFKPPLFLI